MTFHSFSCFSASFRRSILSGGWGHDMPQTAFMLQVRNIFALVISHFYGKMQKIGSFPVLLYFYKIPELREEVYIMSNIPSLILNTNDRMPLFGAWRI